MPCCSVAADKIKTNGSHFYCCGEVPTEIASSPYSLFELRHGMFWRGEKKAETGIEYGKEVYDETNQFIHRVCDPAVPVLAEIPEELYVGRTIEIEGVVEKYPNRFAINLLAGKSPTSNIYFHFNARFDRRIVVRNSRVKGVYGGEEISTNAPFPFAPLEQFLITIFVADGAFKVAVNNWPFCKFAYRYPLAQIRAIEIIGDISVKSLLFHNSKSYPIALVGAIPYVVLPLSRDGTKPLIERLTDLIRPGTNVDISGRVKLLPQSFYVNLQVGSSMDPHPEIPFHMNLRLCSPGRHSQQMIFNSWHSGKWGEEIISNLCPFAPGMTFDLRISYVSEGFNVYVNGDYLMSFLLRLSEPCNIDTVLVEGDVIISNVKIKSTKITSVLA